MVEQSSIPNIDSVQEEHTRMTQDFLKKAMELGYGDLRNYYWYHTIDLGNELITPGTYDYRSNLAGFQFPDDLRGKSVLDVGSATGFFAFEFEKLGAEVVSIEIPSIEALDRFPGETIDHVISKLDNMMPSQSAYSQEQRDHLFHSNRLLEFYNFFLDGPFQFCHQVLNSKVIRRYSTIYDLSSRELGDRKFDLVFIGDVLLHTINPLQALANVAALCQGTLILSQALPSIPETPPAMVYMGGEIPGVDDFTWWWPNRSCFEQLFKKMGFQTVAVVGHNSGILRPGGGSFERTIFHAIR